MAEPERTEVTGLPPGTLALSWGAYGGFYLHRHRICLGWVALTLIPRVEIEDLMRAYIETQEAR